MDKKNEIKHNYWIENTNDHGHLGKCLWCPNSETGRVAGWLYPDEMKKGDYVIHHYFGSEKYPKGFIGRSKIKSIRKITEKQKLKEELQKLSARYDKLKRDKDSYNIKYSEFNLVYLKDFIKFPNNINTKEAYEQIGNLSDFEYKVFVGKKGKKEGQICQMYIRKVNHRFFKKIIKLGPL